MDNVIIFPNTLFEDNDLLDKNTNVIIYEHPVFFTEYEYHKMKLVLHRASMKFYADYIKKEYKCKVQYVEYNKSIDSVMKKLKGKLLSFHDPTDHMVNKILKPIAKKHKITLDLHDTPLFLTTIKDLKTYYKDQDKLRHDHFYKWQRRRMNLLMNGSKPKGGKWTYDSENRKPFPKNFKKNYKPKENTDKYVKEAKKYVEKHFKKNPGSPDLYYPIDFKSSKTHFRKFLKERFDCYGPYQDAVDEKIPFGCHSLISAMLNIGILTPKYVIDTAIEFGDKYKVPIQSVEGFIRQVIGWRESMRLLYLFHREDMDKTNELNHRRKLPQVWFDGKGTTGFKVMDDMIQKTLDNAYLHHIERLMYTGNFFIICQIKPEDVFEWYQTMFIDAYHWVMYGNVYAMSQFSVGKLFMTRPYFSSSNYIDKMSSYKKKKDFDTMELSHENYQWHEVWDALYYNFINDNQKEFKKNYAIARQVKHWTNKSKKEQQEIKDLAASYFRKYK